MKQILVYSDSLSWGIIPGTRQRLPFNERWPGVMENALNPIGVEYRVIENCLNGRRTVFEDPFRAGRNGLEGLAQVIEYNSPLELVILMLATNDFQSMHSLNAWHSAQGMQRLINEIRQAPIEPSMTLPPILVVSPPAFKPPQGDIAPKFEGADTQSIGLSEALERVCYENGVAFLDGSTATETSDIDGVHLDASQHRELGQAITDKVRALLAVTAG